MSGSVKIEGFARNLAFIVAIDKYIGVPKLQTPVADAEALKKCLIEKHGFDTELLLDSDATLIGLRRFLAELPNRVGSDDRVLFYFAGHGTTADKDDGAIGYILPQDAKRNSDATYLPMIELNAALASLPCRHMLVLLDCCFAGALRWASTRHLALAPEALHQERYKWFISDPAWLAIASAAHDQRALDVADGRALGKRDDRTKHSPFALALIEGLEGMADRAPVGKQGDGVITATELYQHLVDALLPRDHKDFRQTPMFWPLKKDDKGQFVFLVPGKELDLPPAPPLDPEANPWRGLSAYSERDGEIFYGRKAASDHLLERIMGKAGSSAPDAADDRFVVVTGPSGIGKSSLVKAGLLPNLPAGRFRSIVVRPSTPGPSAFASLASALQAANLGSQPSPDEQTLKTDMSSLAEWVKAQSDQRQIVLVVDQAEELIMASDDPTQLQEFSALVATALNDLLGLHVVLVLRSEFEPQFSQSAFQDRWSHARFLLPQMTQDELRRVIEGPAAVRVMRFETAELVDKLVNEVVNMPGALPALSFALSQMYRSYLARRGADRALTRADYDALAGGVNGSLRMRANQVINEGDDHQRVLARRVLERFVSVDVGEFTRRRVPAWEFDIADRGEAVSVSRILKRLDEELLIVTDSAQGTTYFELAHDALIRGWGELQDWLRRDGAWIGDLRRLTADANVWDKAGRDESSPVWDDEVEAGTIRRLKAAVPHTLSRIEEAFAEASLRRAARNRIIRWSAVAALAILAMTASIGFFIARQQTLEAIHQAAETKRQNTMALHSHSLAQVMVATQYLDAGDRDRAAAEALAGLPMDLDKPERPVVPALIDVLDVALSQPTPQVVIPSSGWVIAVDERNGLVAVGLKGSGTLELWNIVTGTKIASRKSGHGTIDTLDFNLASGLLLSTGDDNIARVWRMSDLAAEPVLKMDTKEPLTHGWLVADGARAFTLTKNGLLALWDAKTGKLIERWQAHSFADPSPGIPQRTPTPVLATAVSRNGDYLVTGGDDGTVKIWSSRDAKLIRTIQVNRGWVITVAIDDDAQVLVTAGTDRIAKVWKLHADPPPPPTEINQIAWPVQFRLSPDRPTLLVGMADGRLEVISLDDGSTLKTLPHHLGGVSLLRFSQDGSRLLTASEAGPALQIWATKDFALLATLRFQDASPKDALFVNNDHVVSLAPGLITSWKVNIRDKQEKFAEDTSILESVSQLESIQGSLVAGKIDKVIVVWDTKHPRSAPVTLRGHARDIYKFEFGSNGKKIITAGWDGLSVLWDTATGRPEQVFRHRDVVEDARILSDNQRVLTSSRDRSAVIWNILDGSRIATMEGKKTFVNVEIAKDEKTVVGVNDNDDLLVWRALDGTLLRKIQTPDWIHKFAIMPDSKSVVVSFASGKIVVYDLSSDRSPAVLSERRGKLADIDFSDDGLRMITVGEDGSAAIWDIKSLSLISSLKSEVTDVWGAALDNDGRRAYVTGGDGAVVVWKPDTNVVLRRVSVADIVPYHARPYWGENRILALGKSGFQTSIDISTFGDGLSKLGAEESTDQALLDHGRVQISRPVPPAPADLILGREDADANDCDRLAANMFDPNKRTSGVVLEKIDPERAEIACRVALQNSPFDVRARYQLGRVLLREGRYKEAIAEYDASIQAGYAMAYVGRYHLFNDGRDTTINDQQALGFLRTASERGVGAAASILADEFLNGKRTGQNKTEALELYDKAAKLGYPYAHLKLSEIYEAGEFVPRDIEKALYHQIIGVSDLARLGTDVSSETLRRASLARLVSPAALLRIWHMATMKDLQQLSADLSRP